MDRFIAFTGGPGSGKSTLLAALAEHGFARSREAGRAIIQDQVAIGGSALPWDDREGFAAQMLGFEMRSYRIAETTDGTVLFDRGVPDIIGYRRMSGLPVPPELEKAARIFRYNPVVFVAPPWREIFAQDTERKQSFADAEATFHAVSAAYTDCGYELVTLPRADVPTRAAFVLEQLKMGSARCT